MAKCGMEYEYCRGQVLQEQLIMGEQEVLDATYVQSG